MKLVTDYRGEVEYEAEDILTFEEGLYGFEDSKKFLLIANVEKELPFHWLQSLDDEGVVFVITDPFLFVEKYDFKLDDLTIQQLHVDSIEDIQVYSLVIVPKEVKDITVNLKSPLIININDRKAKQVILDGDYPLKYQLFNEEEN